MGACLKNYNSSKGESKQKQKEVVYIEHKKESKYNQEGVVYID